MITAEEWYDLDPDLTQFCQGDIVDDVPYFIFPNHLAQGEVPKWKLLRPKEQRPGESIEQAMNRPLPIELTAKGTNAVQDRWKYPQGEYFAAVARKMRVMIVTRSCALDRDTLKHWLVAPVVAFADLPEAQRSQQRLDSIRNLEKFDWFYLAAQEPIAEGFADLTHLMPVHWSFFGDQPSTNLKEPRAEDPAKRKSRFAKRLSELSKSKLQEVLSDSYGTIFGFDHEDVCPQAGDYACSRCFYTGSHEITRKTFTEQDVDARTPFGRCERCGDITTWVKMVPEPAQPRPEAAQG